MGYKLDLDNPITLNEKINWLKLYDRKDLHTTVADKFKVRDYIKSKIGEQYLVPLLFQSDNPKELLPENLPDIPFIIKANHDSSGGQIVKNKADINWKKIQQQFKKRLKENYFYSSREWQYKNIKPTIIAEKLLTDKNEKIPFDYKIHCFNGKVRMIQVDIDRNSDSHYRNWYNAKWEREPYKWSSSKGNGKYTDPSDYEIDRPDTLDNMIQLSEKLSEDFIYVRVDWYDVDGKLYFGELTFHHDGGTSPILPKEWDENLGKQLLLTI
ncbi:ATP-grasp fold amidoligase family protein [Winogradskyella sp. SM1960]|uniref:ATP-grasp fold amidoligase family protein n=1 Tax=Winogradskyella sp. SM1960 TaxID=2865955 RepID=UPI001CD65142|nr:ATP-grasp fold amidoligase family protein [Winogradskyella sp. SM1960]